MRSDAGSRSDAAVGGLISLMVHAQDSRLTDEYIDVRHVRFADGPDAVHLREIGKMELLREPSSLARQVSGTNENIARYGKFNPTEPRARL